uniref:G_PROTEIN_RECEP_F1_2 domain-containing protein n=1 Tax=Macrostomum lignano TaxID=282301 RepID=A0A1I8FT91_9PLAT
TANRISETYVRRPMSGGLCPDANALKSMSGGQCTETSVRDLCPETSVRTNPADAVRSDNDAAAESATPSAATVNASLTATTATENIATTGVNRLTTIRTVCPTIVPYAKPLRQEKGVVYLYGPSGVGKTHTVFEHCGDRRLDVTIHSVMFIDYLRPDLFDDNSDVRLSLLRLINGNTFTVNAKYQSVRSETWRNRLLVFAGHDPVASYSPGVQCRLKNGSMLRDRLVTVIYVGHPLDGTYDCDETCVPLRDSYGDPPRLYSNFMQEQQLWASKERQPRMVRLLRLAAKCSRPSMLPSWLARRRRCSLVSLLAVPANLLVIVIVYQTPPPCGTTRGHLHAVPGAQRPLGTGLWFLAFCFAYAVTGYGPQSPRSWTSGPGCTTSPSPLRLCFTLAIGMDKLHQIKWPYSLRSGHDQEKAAYYYEFTSSSLMFNTKTCGANAHSKVDVTLVVTRIGLILFMVVMLVGGYAQPRMQECAAAAPLRPQAADVDGIDRDSGSGGGGNGRSSKYESRRSGLRGWITNACVILGFLVCWLPFFIYKIAIAIGPGGGDTETGQFCIIWFTMNYTSINVAIYGGTYKPFKKGAKRFIGRAVRRK